MQLQKVQGLHPEIVETPLDEGGEVRLRVALLVVGFERLPALVAMKISALDSRLKRPSTRSLRPSP
jgi:hypothetical protein